MASYYAQVLNRSDGVITVGLIFGEPAQNDQIVKDAIAGIQALKLARSSTSNRLAKDFGIS